jgi:hypothetical protein
MIDLENIGATRHTKIAGDEEALVGAARWKIVAGILIALAVIVVAVVLLTGDSNDSPSVDPTIATHQNYHQAQYDAGIANAWAPDGSDRRIGSYLESSWRYPFNQAAAFTIYSSTAGETGSPAAAADLARVQIHKLPGYRERGQKEIRLRGIPAVRWTFGLPGTVYVEYFFEECGIGLITRASAPAGIWDELASLFQRMATLTTANCDG